MVVNNKWFEQVAEYEVEDIGVNNNKEEMKMEHINNNGVNVNEAVNTRVNNTKEEMTLMNNKIVNSEGLKLREVWDEVANEGKIIRDFQYNPSKYVNDVEDMGIEWREKVDELHYEIYSQFIRDHGDDFSEGAKVLKSGEYSDRIKEIAEEHGVKKAVDIHEGRIYDEDWDLTYLEYYDIEDAQVADDLDEGDYYYGMLYLSDDDYDYYKELNEAYGVIEDFKMNPGKYVYHEEYKTDGWQAEFETYSDEVYRKFMDRFEDGYPEVMARRLESGWFGEYIIEILRKVISARIWNDPYAITALPFTVKETPYGIYLIAEYVDIREAVEIDSVNYTEYDMHRVLAELGDTLYGYHETEDVDGYEQRTKFMKSKELQVIKLADPRFISEKDLWETIGAPGYTLPLFYAIENLIASYVENDELDEEVMNHTDEIIKTLVNKGEFIYVIKDGELHGVEGVTSTGIEAVELMVPYLLELEKAADELWGFTRVVNNLNIRDDVKSNMMMELFADDVYSFVYQYCRDIYWDGGSN